jgi:hypothetical protein
MGNLVFFREKQGIDSFPLLVFTFLNGCGRFLGQFMVSAPGSDDTEWGSCRHRQLDSTIVIPMKIPIQRIQKRIHSDAGP